MTKTLVRPRNSSSSIVTVPVKQKMLTYERRDLLVLLRARFFCPFLAFWSISKAFVSVLSVKNQNLCVRI